MTFNIQTTFADGFGVDMKLSYPVDNTEMNPCIALVLKCEILLIPHLRNQITALWWFRVSNSIPRNKNPDTLLFCNKEYNKF